MTMANPSPALPAPEAEASDEKSGRSMVFWIGAGLVAIVAVFLLALVLAVVIAIAANPDDAETWISIIRDVFIIVLALEGMLMGIALLVLVLQIAALIDLLQNEIQPIIDNTQETVSTVRGTAQFMSQNVVQPVIKASAYSAGLASLARELLALRRDVRRADGKRSKTDASS